MATKQQTGWVTVKPQRGRQDRSGGERRRKLDRRHRAVLVERDRRSGWDRRSGDRRES